YLRVNHAFSFRCLAMVAALITTNATAATTGRIYGSILDPTGAAIAGATIKAVNQATGAGASASSDALGNYLFAGLPVGTWTITAASPGFKTAIEQSVLLLVDQQVRVDMKMELGETAETVRVEGTAAQVDTSS